MKKLFLLFSLLILGVAGLAFAADQAADIARHPSCAYCGMSRQMAAKSRMEIEYADGSSSALCSLHCAALDLANKMDSMPKAIKVADYNTGELIDAEKAVWVLGGKIPGIMTGRAKWAVADKAAAEKLAAESGGTVVDFETAIRAAYDDMYQDTMMIRKKRQEMHMKGQGMPMKMKM
ncbi:MAG: nitrous oxide reductase accessory protein NosL [Desulfobacteraceae bacterium]|nr:nitrous oxide reductase accessory protein NosL [Desulfobacteraceae bacterium]